LIDKRAVLTALGAATLTAFGMWLVSCTSIEVARSNQHVSWSQGRMGDLPEKWSHRGEWTGIDSCIECHAEEVADFADAAHHDLLDVGADGWGCEACHGPAANHIAADSSKQIDSFERMTTTAVAERCARCHFEDLRALDAAGTHAGAATNNCSWCHAIHPYSIQAFPAEDGPYTVSDCGSCHADAMQVHLSSKHASLVDDCGACHSGGEEHLYSGGAPGSITNPTEEQYQNMCIDCHQSDSDLHNWQTGDHAAAGLNCLDCHQVLERAGRSVAANEIELCASCHPSAAAEFMLPSHHPIGEDEIACSSCHDVHSGDGLFSARQIQSECEACHQQFAGPFAYEHEADRFDGCGACHAGHGSPNRRLLKQTPIRNLCLECHADTPINHNLQGFSVFQNCLDCHTEIHGSHLDRTFFR